MTKLEINIEYAIGDVVYLRTRDARLGGMVTGLSVCPSAIGYYVTWGHGSESLHYGFELSSCYVPDWETDATTSGEAKA